MRGQPGAKAPTQPRLCLMEPPSDTESEVSQSHRSRSIAQLGSASRGTGTGLAGSGRVASGSGGGKAGASRAARPGAAAARQKTSASTLRQQFAVALADTLEAELVSDVSMTFSEDAEGGSKRGGRFRGVTRHKRTQRFEAHIWEAKKQIYLGGFDSVVLAAKSHDIMALKCKDTINACTNFDAEEYAALMPYISAVSREDVVSALRTFSKAHVAARQQPQAGALHRTTQGRVQKAAAPPSPPPAKLLPVRKLSINTAASLAADAGLAVGSPPPSPVKTAALGAPKRPTRSLASLPATPKGSSRERPAPMTPTFPAHLATRPGKDGVEAPAMETPFISPFQRASPLMFGATPAAPAAATGAAAPIEGPPLQSSEGGGSGGRPSMHSSGAWQGVGAGGTIAMEEVSSTRLLLAEEPSLTFSASEEGRLYEWTPVDSAHSGLENTLTGTVLFRSPQQRAEHDKSAQALARELQPWASSWEDMGPAIPMQQGEPEPDLLIFGGRAASEVEVQVLPAQPQSVVWHPAWSVMPLRWRAGIRLPVGARA